MDGLRRGFKEYEPDFLGAESAVVGKFFGYFVVDFQKIFSKLLVLILQSVSK